MPIDTDRMRQEIARRRSFAIISHPDAGKTTMTEKLLLYGGAIHLAGSVKARKAQRHATSDWMEIEQKRGISVTSSVMQFEYEGFCVNILDTPGHQDFSEDTYRTLCAADAAVMLIDAAKGVEPQTIKLFQVCRLRQIPIFTFINKMDRAAIPPFDLIDELEKVLGIQSYPMNWPIGIHGDFKGVYKRREAEIELYDSSSSQHGQKQVLGRTCSLNEARDLGLEEHYLETLNEEIELLDVAGEDFSEERIRQGQLTPVFFGSAINNFGMAHFLEHFLAMAPPPSPRQAEGRLIQADEPFFSGFVFKIQANMNPEHRDRLAFIRICSGVYERNMEVRHMREGRTVRLAPPQQFLAQSHKLVDEAYAGDIIGVFDPGIFRIGDSICSKDEKIRFADIPVFPAENFARIQPKDSMRRKQFLQGMQQLSQEGAVQLYKQPDIGTETYIAGVVGSLQFDVLAYRLRSEYKVELLETRLNYRYARWIEKDGLLLYSAEEAAKLSMTSTTLLVEDQEGAMLLLFESEWAMAWVLERNKGIRLLDIGMR